MMKKTVIFCSFIYLFCALSLPLFAVGGILSIPDSAEVRERALETWIAAPINMVVDKPVEIHYTKRGQGFQISSDLRGSELAVVFAPREHDYLFPEFAPGGWTMYRDIATGKINRIHVYFQHDPRIYLCLRPDDAPKKPKVQADLIIHGAYASRGTPLGIDFESILTLSFRDLYNLTAETLPWNYVKADTRNYPNNQYMVEKIRRKLANFEYVADAGYDENGAEIFLSTGEERSGTPGKISVDADGFTKWVVDGIVNPLTGCGLKLEPLKRPTFDVNETLFASSAPVNEMFRTYDWVRNLSTAVVCAERDNNFEPGTLGMDVKVNPFAGMVSRGGPVRNVGFIPQTGYDINLIKPLLYVLAATEPDMMYLGAVKTGAPGMEDQIETWTFHHDAVFFPYFDATGVCRVVVFESGVETNFEDFINQHQGSYVYLCRVKSSPKFSPVEYQLPEDAE